jgi:gamma-glutamyltranspeptidase/glutathione hydrolase
MFTTRPELTGDVGMVAATHWLAAQVGMSLLEAGGNAFDAAVAAGFTLQVVEPHLNGPGGEVPMLVQPADRAEPVVVAGQGQAPRAASAARLRELGLDLVPGTGHLAACVPGAFDAWLALLAEFGTATPRQVLAPAIGYARGGYPVLPRIAETIGTVAELFTEHWPTSAAVYLPGGTVPAPGGRLANPVLADTYERILTEAERAGGDRERQIEAARDAFYRGFVAEAIEKFVREPVLDVTGERHAGLLDGDDLAGWRTPIERPAWLDYGRYRVFKTGPWGQGPVFLQQLSLLAGFDLDHTEVDDPQFVHLVTEVAKLCFADRDAYYGDPRYTEVPLDELLSEEYAAERRRLVTDTASDELRPGSAGGRTPALPEVSIVEHAYLGVGEPTVGRRGGESTGVGEPTEGRRGGENTGVGEPTVDASGATQGDTCHVDVVDAAGNMISATPSGGWLQSSPVIPQLGFGLGTRAQMFWLRDGLPAMLRPGARPRTTLSPSLAHYDGRPYLAFGTPGGDQQDQWSLLLFLRHVHHGLGLQEAIDAPAFHTTHFLSSFWPRQRSPREVVVESRFAERSLAELRRRGHRVTVSEPWSLGRLSAVSRGRDGFLHAAANPRGMQGYAVGR